MASVRYGLLIWTENAFYQIVGFVFLEVCVTQLRFCHLSYPFLNSIISILLPCSVLCFFETIPNFSRP